MLKGHVAFLSLIICILFQFLHGGPGGSKSTKCLSEENLLDPQEQDTSMMTLRDRGPNFMKIPIVRKSKQKSFLAKLRLNPTFFITFMNRETASAAYDNNFRELVSNYFWFLCGKSVMLNLISELVTFNGEDLNAKNDEAISLLFFKSPLIQLKNAVSTFEFVDPKWPRGYFAEARKLFPSDWKSQTFLERPMAYILFMPKPDDGPNREVIKYINQDMKVYLLHKYQKAPGRFALWGSEMYGSDIQSPGFSYSTPHFAMRYYGSVIQSWSMLVNRRHSVPQIEEKMKKFKEVLNVREGQKIIALNLQSTVIGESLTMTDEIFSEIFPGIKLVTMNIKSDLEKYCIDNWLDRSGELQNDLQLSFDWNYNCYLVTKYD